MPAGFVFATLLLHLTVSVETVVIVILFLLVCRLAVVGERRVRQRDQARRERDEARQVLQTLRRMSEIRVETVARIRGFPR
jgi:hypothetical protein